MTQPVPTVFPPDQAQGSVRDAYGEIRTVSSFGPELTTLGPTFSAHAVYHSQRFRELEWRDRFYKCTQHDHKGFDFNGRVTKPGEWFGTQPFIGGSQPTFFVPLDQRRPMAPYRLGRIIVNRFTSLVFGHGRWPSLNVVGDPEAEDFVNALVEKMNLPRVMIRARNLGGSCGTVGISWRITDGEPRASVHSGKFLHVFEWEDREEAIPSHVMELYQTARDYYDPNKKKLTRKLFWKRRDWTTESDIVFKEAEVTKDEPIWQIESIDQHDDGFTHFVWVENLPEEDGNTIDGLPDYEGIFEQMNAIDTLNSVVVRGAQLNLDPTLVLKMEQEELQAIRKGSDNALAVGPQGDARYLELSGQSLTAGKDLINNQSGQALDTVQCVIPDPDKLAAAGMSSVAIKAIYQPMLDRADVFRDQYGNGVIRLIKGVMRAIRERQTYVEVDAETGEETIVEGFVRLPPRQEEEPEIDETTGKPTGNVNVVTYERKPGESENYQLDWPEYFRPTADDKQKKATTLTTATGGKPVVSQQTAAEDFARTNGWDPEQEWQRLVAQQQAEAENLMGMTPDFGGEVAGDEELPPGALPEDQMPTVGDEGEQPAPEQMTEG